MNAFSCFYYANKQETYFFSGVKILIRYYSLFEDILKNYYETVNFIFHYLRILCLGLFCIIFIYFLYNFQCTSLLHLPFSYFDSTPMCAIIEGVSFINFSPS